MNTWTTTPVTCWNCGGTELQSGGTDDTGRPITVCETCGERQEEE